MPAGTDTQPAITREIIASILVGPLETASIYLASGVRMFDTDGSPVRVPRLRGMTDAPTFVGENEEIPDTTEPVTDEVVLLPREMKSVKIITRFSRELARQSVVALDAALRDKIVRDVAGALDSAFFAGEGGDPLGTEPLGLINQPGVVTVPAVGDLTLDVLLDTVGVAMAANVDLNRLRWFFTPGDWVELRRLKDGQQRFQLSPDPAGDPSLRLLGIPVALTNRLPSTEGTDHDESVGLLADMSTVAVARDLNPSVTILNERYAEFDQIGLRITARMDSKPLLPESVVVLRGITKAP